MASTGSSVAAVVDCTYLPGTFRFRMTIQTVSQSPDGQGGFTESWVDGSDVWASLEPLKGWERMQAMQMQTPVTHKIVMRYRTDIDTSARLKYGTRIFNIKEMLNIQENNRFLQIKALEQQ